MAGAGRAHDPGGDVEESAARRTRPASRRRRPPRHLARPAGRRAGPARRAGAHRRSHPPGTTHRLQRLFHGSRRRTGPADPPGRFRHPARDVHDRAFVHQPESAGRRACRGQAPRPRGRREHNSAGIRVSGNARGGSAGARRKDHRERHERARRERVGGGSGVLAREARDSGGRQRSSRERRRVRALAADPSVRTRADRLLRRGALDLFECLRLARHP